MMNLVEQARALQEMLERVHKANPHHDLETRYSVLKTRLAQVVTECEAYLERVRQVNDEQALKCPKCEHRWGLHLENGEFQDYLGCTFDFRLGRQSKRCGCLESPPKHPTQT